MVAAPAKALGPYLHRAIAVKGAEPGDVLEVRILDMVPQLPSRNPDLQGVLFFGSSVAAWWGLPL